ncbi:unnamed protein product [Tuwongella immobilis]|uniref:Uncharacterized protein n=1 Tax=Tuwongella immobilis TaxID=692036 RepID=A0A6C2YKS7_9BACT|nr:unnamed protein product [Tuwongella immobilis]VTS00627.1 unnamed protein product [Tuwongella immobilis]
MHRTIPFTLFAAMLVAFAGSPPARAQPAPPQPIQSPLNERLTRWAAMPLNLARGYRVIGRFGAADQSPCGPSREAAARQPRMGAAEFGDFAGPDADQLGDLVIRPGAPLLVLEQHYRGTHSIRPPSPLPMHFICPHR